MILAHYKQRRGERRGWPTGPRCWRPRLPEHGRRVYRDTGAVCTITRAPCVPGHGRRVYHYTGTVCTGVLLGRGDAARRGGAAATSTELGQRRLGLVTALLGRLHLLRRPDRVSRGQQGVNRESTGGQQGSSLRFRSIIAATGAIAAWHTSNQIKLDATAMPKRNTSHSKSVEYPVKWCQSGINFLDSDFSQFQFWNRLG